MKKFIFNIILIIVYLIAGVLIIVGSFVNQDLLIGNLNWLAGLTLFFGALVSLMDDIKLKKYKVEGNRIPSHMMVFILSIIMILSKYIFSENKFDVICNLWGICAILNACFIVSSFIPKVFNKNISIMELVEGVGALFEIVLSIFLIINPEEHITAHLLLLGIDYIITLLVNLEGLIVRKNEEEKNGLRL